ncbi:MAG TPA: hypothetical protein VER08_03470 [Pyrinomonadaceae bacterium]|nr:hypothetical protein [Pyrinomonadaceae bacterium]
MMKVGRVSSSLVALALVAQLGTSALAQQRVMVKQDKPPAQQQGQSERVVVEQEHVVVTEAGPLPPLPMKHPSGDTFVFLSTEMSFGGRLVKGAPYSGEAVTETVQTLADGNRIVRKNTAQIYRDSEGRTRREQTFAHVGPFAVAGEPSQTIFINDPVGNVNYILDPKTRTARKLVSRFRVPMKPGEGAAAAAGGGTGQRRARVESEVRSRVPGAPGDMFTIVAPPPPMPGGDFAAGVAAGQAHVAGQGGHTVTFERRAADLKKEPLGKRSFDGVEADGTRHTHTIAAGEIGNEQPINVVTETWYSPELQVVVMSRHSDPRFGETTYRLNNINRGEPARTLFEPPSDYTVKEGPQVRTFAAPRPPREVNQ